MYIPGPTGTPLTVQPTLMGGPQGFIVLRLGNPYDENCTDLRNKSAGNSPVRDVGHVMLARIAPDQAPIVVVVGIVVRESLARAKQKREARPEPGAHRALGGWEVRRDDGH